jgi:hypothetical protein
VLHAVPEHALPSLHCALLLAPSPAQIPLLQTEEAIAERFACLSLTRSLLHCTALHCMFCFVLYCSHLPSHSHTTLSVSTYVYIHRGCFIPVFPSLRRRRRKTRPAGHGEERRRDRSTPLVRFLPALLRRQRQRHLPLICPSVRPRSPAAGHGRKATRMAVALLACRRPACSAGAAC